MKKKLNKKTLCLTAAALTLTAGLSVGSAMAYHLCNSAGWTGIKSWIYRGYSG